MVFVLFIFFRFTQQRDRAGRQMFLILECKHFTPRDEQWERRERRIDRNLSKIEDCKREREREKESDKGFSRSVGTDRCEKKTCDACTRRETTGLLESCVRKGDGLDYTPIARCRSARVLAVTGRYINPCFYRRGLTAFTLGIDPRSSPRRCSIYLYMYTIWNVAGGCCHCYWRSSARVAGHDGREREKERGKGCWTYSRDGLWYKSFFKMFFDKSGKGLIWKFKGWWGVKKNIVFHVKI